MSKAFIRVLSVAIQKATSTQELLLRMKPQTEDSLECLDNLDSIINTLHGLREEEKEIAEFEGQFLESRFEEEDEDDLET